MQYVIGVLLLAAAAKVSAQVVDLKMDFQTNSIMQLSQAQDGAIWGITSSNIDRLPTIAGVWAIRSTDGGKKWESSAITEDWWRWGVDICAVSASTAWALTKREDTVELYRTTDGGKHWLVMDPLTLGLDRPVNVHFFSSKVGVVIGTQGRRIERKWVAARTTDGGATWTQSLPLLAEPPTEDLASLNDRSAAWDGALLYVPMNAGRVLFTTDEGKTWQFMASPLGRLAGLTVEYNGKAAPSLRLFANRDDQTVKSLATTDGTSWKDAPVRANLTRLSGVRTLANGHLVTVPRALYNTPCVDVDTGERLGVPDGADALLPLKDGLLCGQEVMPGQGLIRIPQP
jgi:photosystem II stability/assembly factor-like uncharacterized protein